MRIVIGQGSCGIAAGAEKVRQALLNENISAPISITGCIGMCYLEPIVDIYDEDKLTRLVKVSADDAPAIAEYIHTGDRSKIENLVVTDEDSEFLNKQTRIALRNCGIINPEIIEEYIDRGGYTAFKSCLTEKTPEEVIEIIKTSGLAGRGGAGFPTWFKWNAARQSEGEEKYLICNADEGDPGASQSDRGYADRRVCHRRKARGRLCKSGVSPCHQATEKRSGTSKRKGHHRQQHLRHGLLLRLHDQGRCGRVRLR